MTDDKVNVPIKITLDGSDIKRLVKDEFNSVKKEDKTLKRDKIILTHIQHRYDEEERRFQTVDSKISSMIAVLIMIFTIQGSLFTNILSNMDKINICLIVLFSISLVLYLISIGFFIYAHYFEKFSATPSISFLMKKGENDESEHDIVKNMIGLYGSCVDENYEIIENKTSIAKKGFLFLICGGCLSFIFFICFLFELFI